MILPNTRTTTGPTYSLGAQLVWARMQQDGLSLEDVRRMCKLPRGMVNRYLYGDRRAPLAFAVACERLFRIKPSTWLMPPQPGVIA